MYWLHLLRSLASLAECACQQVKGTDRHLFDISIEFIEFIIDANACGRILAADA